MNSTYEGISPQFREYAARLELLLKPKRFAHSLGVARLARRLAEYWGADADRAELAGLLHDVAKNLEPEALIAYCERHGIDTDTSFSLLHAPAGALMLREEWGIEDGEIISAVATHTVAVQSMSDLQRIVYLADIAEESRDFEGVEKLRRLIFEDMDEAMLFSLSESIADLRKKGKYVAPESIKTMEFYERLCAEKGKNMKNPADILKIAAEAAIEKKAEDVISMNLQGLTLIADFFLLATGRNNRQVQAIADNIAEKAEENGITIAHIEGYAEGKWILLDLGSVIIHVFQPEERQYYNLERLWGDAAVENY